MGFYTGPASRPRPGQWHSWHPCPRNAHNRTRSSPIERDREQIPEGSQRRNSAGVRPRRIEEDRTSLGSNPTVTAILGQIDVLPGRSRSGPFLLVPFRSVSDVGTAWSGIFMHSCRRRRGKFESVRARLRPIDGARERRRGGPCPRFAHICSCGADTHGRSAARKARTCGLDSRSSGLCSISVWIRHACLMGFGLV